MIPKGNQRSGGQQLATHLLNAYDNERVEVVEVRGSVAQDLHGAFAEWQAISKATQCRKYLYSLSINPDHRQGPFSRDDYYDFIGRTENKLGLSDQPRAVVFHVKEGREHCHVVWSRIDGENLKAIQLSHDRQKLRSVAQEYARDRGIELPPGMREDRGKERFRDNGKNVNLTEKQQEERTGISKEERRQAITAAWRESDSSKAFLNALTERGYYIARGDKRGFVVVDTYGEVHSLSRQLEGVKAKELKDRLADYPLDQLPDVAGAQEFAARQREALRSPEPPSIDVWQRRAELQQAQAKRRAVLEEKNRELVASQEEARKKLQRQHERTTREAIAAREARKPSGFAAFLAGLPGVKHYIQIRQQREDRQREEQQAAALDALQRAQDRQRQDFQRHFRSLSRVEKREQQSLETEIRRDEFAAMGLQRGQQPRKEQIREKGREELKQPFNEAAGAKEKQPPQAQQQQPDPRLPEQQAKPQTGKISDDLAQALSKRAAKKRQEKGREKGSDPDRSPDEQ